MQTSLKLELNSNRKHGFHVQANFEETIFEIERTVL